MKFVGDCPYVLVLLNFEGEAEAIDLDEPGWRTTHADDLRVAVRWILAKKDNTPVLMMEVADGDEPSYTSRVLGSAFLPPPDAVGKTQDEMLVIKDRAQVHAYGIGKNGHSTWVLPNGVICSGDDVDVFGAEMAKSKLRELLRSKR
jgi:hypothetical protein